MEIPDTLQQHRPCHYAAGIQHQFFEQAEFARLQLDLRVAAFHHAAQPVQRQIADHEHGLLFANGGTTAEGVHPRVEFGEREWLYEIIVGAAFEASDAILDGAHGRQHEHRLAHAGGARALYKRKSIKTWQHAIDDHEIEAVLRGPHERLPAIADELDRLAMLAQALREIGCGIGVIFNDENVHAGFDLAIIVTAIQVKPSGPLLNIASALASN